LLKVVQPYIGRKVGKVFEGQIYKGTVVGRDVDQETGECIFEITYDDGDKEDLSHKELLLVLEKEDIAVVAPPATAPLKVAHF
jgi:hypothetical protein